MRQRSPNEIPTQEPLRLYPPEVRSYLQFEGTAFSRGLLNTGDGLMSHLRNQTALVGGPVVAAVAPAAASGTAYDVALPLVADDVPRTFVVLVYNASDAGVTVSFQDSFSVAGTAKWADIGVSQAVATGKGAVFVVTALGYGDANPQVTVTTTSTATAGGNVTVDVRYN